jgi:signal peptidase I
MFVRFVGLTLGFTLGVFFTEAAFPNNQSWPDLVPFALAVAGALVAQPLASRVGAVAPGRPRPPPAVRWVLIPLASVVLLFVLVVMLDRAQLVDQISAGGSSGMAPTLPGCNARWMSEGFTYHFRDPQRGEIVAIHVRRTSVGSLRPDPSARAFALSQRVIGKPGDTVVGRGERVFVDGKAADDIPTSSFPPVHLGDDEYFVLGDNRNSVDDSRDFGPVPRKAIFARVILIYSPLGRFGPPGYDKHLKPPGPIC